MLRRRPVPVRSLDDKVIVARPADGSPIVLAPTAARVWQLLADWTTADAIDRVFADSFPEVPEAERLAARAEILRILSDDDLVERR